MQIQLNQPYTSIWLFCFSSKGCMHTRIWAFSAKSFWSFWLFLSLCAQLTLHVMYVRTPLAAFTRYCAERIRYRGLKGSRMDLTLMDDTWRSFFDKVPHPCFYFNCNYYIFPPGQGLGPLRDTLWEAHRKQIGTKLKSSKLLHKAYATIISLEKRGKKNLDRGVFLWRNYNGEICSCRYPYWW